MSADVKIYTRAYCGFCTAALSMLKSKGVPYQEVDTGGKPEIRKWLAQETGQTTVPQIFIDGKSIGGFTDMRALDQDGELDTLLAGHTTAAAK